jgi:hypothetical protein
MQLLDRHSSTTLTEPKACPKSEPTVMINARVQEGAPCERLQPVHGLDAVAVQVDLRYRVVAVVAEGLAQRDTMQLSRPLWQGIQSLRQQRTMSSTQRTSAFTRLTTAHASRSPPFPWSASLSASISGSRFVLEADSNRFDQLLQNHFVSIFITFWREPDKMFIHEQSLVTVSLCSVVSKRGGYTRLDSRWLRRDDTGNSECVR